MLFSAIFLLTKALGAEYAEITFTPSGVSVNYFGNIRIHTLGRLGNYFERFLENAHGKGFGRHGRETETEILVRFVHIVQYFFQRAKPAR